MSTEAFVGQMKFTDEDVVDLDSFIPAGEYNPHNVRPWLLHDHGSTIAVVFAFCAQAALDIAVDEGMMDSFMISDAELADYSEEGEGITYLGNASEPFDIESVGIIELPNPPRSFVAEYNAAFGGVTNGPHRNPSHDS